MRLDSYYVIKLILASHIVKKERRSTAIIPGSTVIFIYKIHNSCFYAQLTTFALQQYDDREYC